jgi:hypothetical protein
MNVYSIEFGDEMRQGTVIRPDFALVLLSCTVAGQCLYRRELHALRCIGDRVPLGPLGRVDAPAQLGEFRFRNSRQ